MTFLVFSYKSEHNVIVNTFYVFFFFFYSVFIYVYICVCTESNTNVYFYTVFHCMYLKLNQDLFVYLKMLNMCLSVCECA